MAWVVRVILTGYVLRLSLAVGGNRIRHTKNKGGVGDRVPRLGWKRLCKSVKHGVSEKRFGLAMKNFALLRLF